MYHPIDKHYIYMREQGVCHHCRRSISFGKMTIDHYLPRSRGGTYDVFNLVACCRRCNNYKKCTIPEDVDAVHITLFKRAVEDHKIDPNRWATLSQLILLTEGVDRVVHQGEVTIFESTSHRISVKNNKIAKIIQLKRMEKE